MRSPCLSLPSPRTCLHANIFRCLIKYFLQAQPKHLSCIAVSSFHLACSQLEDQLLAIPEPADLVSISQSRCSASDLLRMEAILATKLDNKQQQVGFIGTPCIVRRRPERDTQTFIIRIMPRHFHSHHHTITLTIVPLHYSLLCWQTPIIEKIEKSVLLDNVIQLQNEFIA